MPRVTLTRAERKTGLDLRDVLRPLSKSKVDFKVKNHGGEVHFSIGDLWFTLKVDGAWAGYTHKQACAIAARTLRSALKSLAGAS